MSDARGLRPFVPGAAPLRDPLLRPRFSFQAVQDPSNNKQNQNHGNGKRVIVEYAHGHLRQDPRVPTSSERPGYEVGCVWQAGRSTPVGDERRMQRLRRLCDPRKWPDRHREVMSAGNAVHDC